MTGSCPAEAGEGRGGGQRARSNPPLLGPGNLSRPRLAAAAVGDIARAKGMAQIARETGLGRESLYKALSPEGNPEFATVLKVVRALGLRLRATPAQA